MIKKKLFIWTCDFSENSGEGKLARLFVKNLRLEENYKIKFNSKKKKKFKYFSVFEGIFFCWIEFLKGNKICFLNYLPFWNIAPFILLPPGTMLGPITGGANFEKSNKIEYFIRGLIFPIFYKLNSFFLYFRFKNIIFSTNLLEKYISNRLKKNYEFNFILKSIKFKKKQKKFFDFIIYYRKHKNKLFFFPYKFIENLAKSKYKIAVIGDKLNIKFVKNYGYKKNNFVQNIQSHSKYTIASGESVYSFFTLECISNNVLVVINKNDKKKISFYKNKFIPLNFKKNNYKFSIKKIKKY